MYDDFKSCLVVSEEEKLKVRAEFGLKESDIEEHVDAILEWFSKLPHLMAAGLPDRSFIETMLVLAKGSREKTKIRIDNLYKYKSLAQDLLQGALKMLEHDGRLFTDHRFYAIPHLYELRRVGVLQFTNPDASNFDIADLVKISLMTGFLRLKYDYIFGDIWVFDMKNTTIGHLLRLNPTVLRKAALIFLDGIGVRIQSIHVLGAPSFVNQVMAFMSAFVNEKILGRVKFHNSLEELYEHVPRKYLPKDYGGDQISMEEAEELYTQALRSEKTKRILEECFRQVSDESKRPQHVIHADSLSGTFKKLELD